jgi:hypothetical protein
LKVVPTPTPEKKMPLKKGTLVPGKRKRNPFANGNSLFFQISQPFETTVFYHPRQQARGSSNAEWVIRSGVGCAQGEVTYGQDEAPDEAPGD